MKRIETLAAWAFGLAFTALGLAVAVETTLRKLFNYSLQGVDELGGYALAVGSALAFCVALLGRGHIRIDLLHELLPRPVRVVLNVVSMISLALCAIALMAMAWTSFSDTLAMRSVAQTPWATPLKYPQAFWLLALGLFLVVAGLWALKALWLVAQGRGDEVDRRFGPKSSNEELAEEIEDLNKRRGTA